MVRKGSICNRVSFSALFDGHISLLAYGHLLKQQQRQKQQQHAVLCYVPKLNRTIGNSLCQLGLCSFSFVIPVLFYL